MPSENVLVMESCLQDIADAIRAKNGSQNTYIPAQMAAAILAISGGGGGGSASLGSKTIRENGSYTASADNLDGFSTVTADVHPGILEPYFTDLTTGYVFDDGWHIGGSDSFSDVYELEANSTYIISLGSTVGTRFRVMFCTTDPTTASANIGGTIITYTNNPAPYSYKIYKPSEDGYLIIQKDNVGVANLRTYVFCLTDLVDGNTLSGGAASLRTLNVIANGTYVPGIGYDGFSEITVNVPQPTLVQKTITENGVYDPADDSAGGYSGLTVDVRPGIVEPYAYDVSSGYVYNGQWVLGGDTVNYSDVYQVEEGKTYLLLLDAVVGTRFRAIFTTQDTTEVTTKISGTRIVNTSDPLPYDTASFTAPSDGYITVTKDNDGHANLKTYVYECGALIAGSSAVIGNAEESEF